MKVEVLNAWVVKNVRWGHETCILGSFATFLLCVFGAWVTKCQYISVTDAFIWTFLMFLEGSAIHFWGILLIQNDKLNAKRLGRTLDPCLVESLDVIDCCGHSQLHCKNKVYFNWKKVCLCCLKMVSGEFYSQTVHTGKSANIIIIFLQNCNLMSWLNSALYIHSTYIKSKDFKLEEMRLQWKFRQED